MTVKALKDLDLDAAADAAFSNCVDQRRSLTKLCVREPSAGRLEARPFSHENISTILTNTS